MEKEGKEGKLVEREKVVMVVEEEAERVAEGRGW